MPTRLLFAHVLVVVNVQDGCPTVPELLGRLQRILVDFVMAGGERNSFLLDLPPLA